MGATNGYITRLILTQSLITATLGFIIAWLLLVGFQKGVASGGLLFRLSPGLLTGLYLLTTIISTGSALFFSIRTIANVEPASVFRN
jgi:putative ABC transport system permease protein